MWVRRSVASRASNSAVTSSSVTITPTTATGAAGVVRTAELGNDLDPEPQRTTLDGLEGGRRLALVAVERIGDHRIERRPMISLRGVTPFES